MNFSTLLGRLHEERREAERSLTAPLERLPRTVPMVSALRAAAIEALFQDVARSRELADRAVLLALDLAPGAYERPLVTQARVQALKDLATVRRHAGDLAGAHEALDEAALLADEEPALGHDRAVLGLARALTFSQEQAYDEALECLREAAQSFVEFGDERRLGQCRHTEGMTQYRVGRYADAIASFNDALKLVGDDLRTTTSLLTNRGFAELESGQLAAAAATFGAALPLAQRSPWRSISAPGQNMQGSSGDSHVFNSCAASTTARYCNSVTSGHATPASGCRRSRGSHSSTSCEVEV